MCSDDGKCTVEVNGTKTEQDYTEVLQNRSLLSNLKEKLNHLKVAEPKELSGLIEEFKDLFSDLLWRSNIVWHEIDVGDAKPIKQHPYKMNPKKPS